ncbi:MAG: PQQ-binding-like beta-propeller repeat protein [Planctomycetes bacterium]|nr:PQQ-binding-like beta-propeller repeat protein [Planctomycetota bacterium]
MTRRGKLSLFPLTGILALGLSLPCFAENWPGFRGPTGQGISSEKNLPLTWSLRENLAWRVDIPGVGWSSPIVWGDRVFVTSANPEGTSCHVLGIDLHSGKILWDREVVRQTTNRKEPQNSHATPTPVTDGRLVFAAFNGGKLAALDFDGHIVWTREDLNFFSKHGLSVSPILYRDLLIMPFDGNNAQDLTEGYLKAWEGAFILALDKKTGREKWRARRGLSRQAHVTPMIIEVEGKPQLISAAGDVVQGFDPETGERLWTVHSTGEGVVPSIVYGQGLIFTSSGFGSPTIRAIRPGGHGDVTATHIVWESRDNVPTKPSFLYTDGLLFCIKETGVISCLDAQTGKTLWRHRLGGNYSASPVLAEGRLYCLGEDGSTTVLAPERQFKRLARNELEGFCQASPAISQGRILIRSQTTLFCLRQGAGKGGAASP